MKCPKCGEEMDHSEISEYWLCDYCKIRIKDDDSHTSVSYNQKVSHPSKKKFGCFGWAVIILTILIGLCIILWALSDSSYDSSGTNETISSEEALNELNVCYDALADQERALNDLISRYESGSESPKTSSERLSGLADGIGNTIDRINSTGDSEYGTALEALATAYKGIATHYSRYIDSGDQSEMKDVETLQSALERLKKDVESIKN